MEVRYRRPGLLAHLAGVQPNQRVDAVTEAGSALHPPASGNR